MSFSLSLPLDFPGGTALNQRRRPPRLAPTEDLEGNPEAFFNIHMSDMDPRYVDVWADDDVTLSLQYSTQWDSLAHVGAEFDVDGDGVEESVYYNGFRADVDIVGPHPTQPATDVATRASANTSASSTWRTTGCRAVGCSSTSPTTSVTNGAAST